MDQPVSSCQRAVRTVVSTNLLWPAILVAASVAGCRQQMADQSRFAGGNREERVTENRRPLRQAGRTIPRGHLKHDHHFLHGTKAELLSSETDVPPDPSDLSRHAEEFPLPITAQLMEHGRERFVIYCTPCHGADGFGRGEVVERGFPQAESLHSKRLRDAPAGYLFHVATRGGKNMPPYGKLISPRDRWAIVAYVRALQWSQHARLDDLPPPLRDRFAGLPPERRTADRATNPDPSRPKIARELDR